MSSDLEAELARLRAAHRLAQAELRRLRAALALPPTRCELADVLGVSERTITRWRKRGLSETANAAETLEWLRKRRRKKPRSKRPKLSR